MEDYEQEKMKKDSLGSVGEAWGVGIVLLCLSTGIHEGLVK